MVNGIRTSNPQGLNKGCGLKFSVGSCVQQETFEGQRIHQPKRWEYNNKDENLNDKNQASSQKVRQLNVVQLSMSSLLSLFYHCQETQHLIISIIIKLSYSLAILIHGN